MGIGPGRWIAGRVSVAGYDLMIGQMLIVLERLVIPLGGVRCVHQIDGLGTETVQLTPLVNNYQTSSQIDEVPTQADVWVLEPIVQSEYRTFFGYRPLVFAGIDYSSS